MSQTQEIRQFVSRCLEKLGPAVKQELMTVTEKLSPRKLTAKVASVGLVPFTGNGSAVLNLWQFCIHQEARFLLCGRTWSTANQTFSELPSGDNQLPIVLIGQGGFSKVYKLKLGMREFAIKKIGRPDKEVKLHMQLREAQQLKEINEKCSHSIILQLYDYWSFEKTVSLLTEYGGKSLSRLNSQWLLLHPLAVLSICHQLFNGVDALHAAKYVHRDLKPSNVMYRLEGQRLILKLIDFGCCCAFDSHWIGSSCGTPAYLGPWIWHRERRTVANLIAADTWAILSTVFSLLNGTKSPLYGPILAQGGHKEWAAFVASSADALVLSRLNLQPPPFPVAEFSSWLVDNLKLMERQKELKQLQTEILAVKPLFEGCNAAAWLKHYEENVKTRSASESTLTDTEEM